MGGGLGIHSVVLSAWVVDWPGRTGFRLVKRDLPGIQSEERIRSLLSDVLNVFLQVVFSQLDHTTHDRSTPSTILDSGARGDHAVHHLIVDDDVE